MKSVSSHLSLSSSLWSSVCGAVFQLEEVFIVAGKSMSIVRREWLSPLLWSRQMTMIALSEFDQICVVACGKCQVRSSNAMLAKHPFGKYYRYWHKLRAHRSQVWGGHESSFQDRDQHRCQRFQFPLRVHFKLQQNLVCRVSRHINILYFLLFGTTKTTTCTGQSVRGRLLSLIEGVNI